MTLAWTIISASMIYLGVGSVCTEKMVDSAKSAQFYALQTISPNGKVNSYSMAKPIKLWLTFYSVDIPFRLWDFLWDWLRDQKLIELVYLLQCQELSVHHLQLQPQAVENYITKRKVKNVPTFYFRGGWTKCRPMLPVIICQQSRYHTLTCLWDHEKWWNFIHPVSSEVQLPFFWGWTINRWTYNIIIINQCMCSSCVPQDETSFIQLVWKLPFFLGWV